MNDDIAALKNRRTIKTWSDFNKNTMYWKYSCLAKLMGFADPQNCRKRNYSKIILENPSKVETIVKSYWRNRRKSSFDFCQATLVSSKFVVIKIFNIFRFNICFEPFTRFYICHFIFFLKDLK